MSVGKRLEVALEKAKLSQSELARRIGVQPSAVNHIISGRTKKIKAETLIAAAAVCTVSPQWLETGVGSMLPEARLAPDEHELLAIFRILPAPQQAAIVQLARSLKVESAPADEARAKFRRVK